LLEQHLRQLNPVRIRKLSLEVWRGKRTCAFRRMSLGVAKLFNSGEQSLDLCNIGEVEWFLDADDENTRDRFGGVLCHFAEVLCAIDLPQNVDVGECCLLDDKEDRNEERNGDTELNTENNSKRESHEEKEQLLLCSDTPQKENICRNQEYRSNIEMGEGESLARTVKFKQSN
jgi:hypothetical protein